MVLSPSTVKVASRAQPAATRKGPRKNSSKMTHRAAIAQVSRSEPGHRGEEDHDDVHRDHQDLGENRASKQSSKSYFEGN